MRGDPLLTEDAMEAIRTRLFPRAELATPNLDEVRLLVGVDGDRRGDRREAAEALHALGARYVLVKGGHLRGSPEVVDLLFDGERTWEFSGPRIDTPHVHGAGDALASATCAALARGLDMPDAVASAERYVRRAVAESYPSAPASARCRRSGRSTRTCEAAPPHVSVLGRRGDPEHSRGRRPSAGRRAPGSARRPPRPATSSTASR